MDTQKKILKEKNLRLRLTFSSWEKLRSLAEADSRNVTNWVEAIIESEYSKLQKRRR